MFQLDVPFVITIVGQIIGLCFFTWRIATQYGILKAEISRNKSDLNNAAKAIREDLKSAYQINQMQICHIQEHLASKDNYHPPSLKGFDRNLD